MNQNFPYLTRQIVYAFLVGLIAGGITIGLFDAYAKKPLFSSAAQPAPSPTPTGGSGSTTLDGVGSGCAGLGGCGPTAGGGKAN